MDLVQIKAQASLDRHVNTVLCNAQLIGIYID